MFSDLSTNRTDNDLPKGGLGKGATQGALPEYEVYFGGKSRVADLVWSRLGDVSNYIEPYFGSGAVLLRRPHLPKIETVNDLDSMICNFWRAIKADPDAVAEYADHPVIEQDLHAIHRWLVIGDEAAEFRRRIKAEHDYFDAARAGKWAWGACCWIGSGWCDDNRSESKQMPLLRANFGKTGQGVNMEEGGQGPSKDTPADKRPQLHTGNSHHGRGVHAEAKELGEQMPRLGSGGNGATIGVGVHAKGPHDKRPNLNGTVTGAISNAGVHNAISDAHRPQLADAYSRGRGVHGNDSAGTCEARRAWLVDWFARLSDRLRTVRVCCGDWLRVCDSPSVTTRLGVTGIFLDAPYKTHLKDGSANRSADLYGNDKAQDVNALVDRVIAYCVERGSDPLMRIAACCYEGEGYEVLGGLGWESVSWKAAGGYGNRTQGGKDNAARERIWFSPHCLDPKATPGPLFDLQWQAPTHQEPAGTPVVPLPGQAELFEGAD